MANIKAQVKQLSPTIYTDGDMEFPVISKIGELFTGDWKQRLLKAGKLWAVSVGSMTAGADIARITGGGSGTCIDQDQPEIAIGVDTGYFLIPVSIAVSGYIDCDADAEYANIIAVVDRTAGVPTSVTGTIETPLNLLDGAGSFPGRAFSAITADITDPTVDEILDEVNVNYQVTTSGVYANLLKMNYVPDVPDLLAGPCGIYVYWGGTAATTAIARVVVAAVPASWFPVS